MNPKSEAAVRWYSENRPTFELLSRKVESIVGELLSADGVPIHAITCRTKDIKSYSAKLQSKAYEDPTQEITDLSGIRAIAYVENDLKRISEIISEHFEIDEKNSVDKRDVLGTDKVGYRSIHFIAQLPADRLRLPEYKKFKGLKFEIQVRTMLQHTWAEIEHDKNYKFSGGLPFHLQRRFMILAGLLELADREFDSLASEIDAYGLSVASDAKKGELEIDIDSTSLREFYTVQFPHLAKKGRLLGVPSTAVLEELKSYGIRTLAELAIVIPVDFEKTVMKYADGRTMDGLTRNIMMIHDANKYFEKSWKQNWNGFSYAKLLLHYNVPVYELAAKHGLEVF